VAGSPREEAGSPFSAAHRPDERCQGQVIQGFIVDFYCHKAALVIEVDGDIHDLQQEEDARREKALTELGLRIVRFRNDEVARDLSAVVGKIKELVAQEAQTNT
jgi:very-short-patch-repair endonuclease